MKFIIFTVLLTLCMRAFATDSALPTFDREQLTRVSAEITKAQAEGREVVLVLGATPSEQENFTIPEYENPLILYFNDKLYTYYSEYEARTKTPDPLVHSGVFIQGDFNNIEHLTQLAEILINYCDLIIPDCSTSKFMSFNPDHLRLFHHILKPSGRMTFDWLEPITGIDTDNKGPTYFDIFEKAKEDRANLIPKLAKIMHAKPLLLTTMKFGPTFFEHIASYNEYIQNWKTKYLPEMQISLSEKTIFPYWKPTGRTETRDQWISEEKYFITINK